MCTAQLVLSVRAVTANSFCIAIPIRIAALDSPDQFEFKPALPQMSTGARLDDSVD